jgi:hypothetical protein
MQGKSSVYMIGCHLQFNEFIMYPGMYPPQ